ncbi:MAG TPA: HAD-IIIA family hydrolase [Sumerlaeia bacterium]|nr:HAD-IIIA family hydrolase [Sumerlaeia bacterium]
MSQIADKFLDRDEVARICRELRGQGRTIGFTSGAYDLLHAGHANFLERARALCDALVVGINTDDSVRRYKGPDRPIIPERQRAEIVAALEAVDYVFLFPERRNARNIELIQPDLYIKAGDYTKSGLTSAEVVERYGGEARRIDIEIPLSTTDIIERVRAHRPGRPAPRAETETGAEMCVSLDAPRSVDAPAKCSPAVFLDRDGTINREIEYLHEPERFELLPGAGEGMRRFADMGYRIVIVTTQAGIGLGYFTKEDFYQVNRAMFRSLAPFGVTIDGIYFCPHGLGAICDCRKPGTALFERARQDLNIDFSRSICIGDKTSDLEAARRLGMTKILVRTGHAGGDREFEVEPDFIASSLDDAARWALDRERA